MFLFFFLIQVSCCKNIFLQYRIEATSRGRYGGVWSAPIHYSLVSESPSQTNVTLLHKFDNWIYNEEGSIAKRLPWLDRGYAHPILTMHPESTYWWGTLGNLLSSIFCQLCPNNIASV